MILCNLAAIMGERRLKISKVAADTGISRTTLTALYYDSGKGVQFETANLLCIYFGITMGELFTTLRFDLFVEDCMIYQRPIDWAPTDDVQYSLEFDCKILTQKTVEFPKLCATLHFPHPARNVSDLKTKMVFEEAQINNSQEEIDALNELFAQLTNAAKNLVEHRFFEAVTAKLHADASLPSSVLGDYIFSTQMCEFPECFFTRTTVLRGGVIDANDPKAR